MLPQADDKSRTAGSVGIAVKLWGLQQSLLLLFVALVAHGAIVELIGQGLWQCSFLATIVDDSN